MILKGVTFQFLLPGTLIIIILCMLTLNREKRVSSNEGLNLGILKMYIYIRIRAVFSGGGVGVGVLVPHEL